MKKFLYLRINALAGIIVSLVLFFYSMSADIQGLKVSSLGFVLMGLFAFGIPVLHNLFLIFIYRRFYPAKEPGRLIGIFNIIFNIVCIVDLLIFITSIVIFPTYNFREEDKPDALMNMVLTAVLSITTTIQIIGGIRLIKIVRENAQLQVETSFV
jgi:hypothetical protein